VGSEQDSTVVAGAASTATGISVSAAGTYYWRAQYSGDSFNEGFTTACGSEVSTIGATYANSANADLNCSDIVIGNGETKTCTITNNDTKAQPSGTTTMSWVLNDSLTISGLRTAAPDAATASVTFRLYSDAQCTTLVGSEQDSTVVAGAASTATGISVSAAGTYYWRAHYSGDSFNEGFTTACGSEVSTIGATYAQ
jgi:hypothetical protein